MKQKSMRKVLSWALTIAMLLTILPTAAFAEEAVSGTESAGKALLSIAVTTLPDEIKYNADEEAFVVTGGKLTLKYSNGTSEEIDLTADMISGQTSAVYDGYGVPIRRYMVSYGGKTATLDIKQEPVVTFTTEFNGNELYYAVTDAGYAFDTVVDGAATDTLVSFAKNGAHY